VINVINRKAKATFDTNIILFSGKQPGLHIDFVPDVMRSLEHAVAMLQNEDPSRSKL
jgi:hypothetical protein